MDDRDRRGLLRLAGAAAFLQLACAMSTLAVVLLLGGEPATAEEYYGVLGEDRLLGLLRLDPATVVSMGLYYVVFLGLWAALRSTGEAWATLATALAFVGITLWLSAHSGLSMAHLANRYAAAGSEAERARLLAAGEAVIASDMWHATPAVVAGILVQTGAVLLSVLMLRGEVFAPLVAWVGIATHGLDLLHVLVGLPFPGAGVVLMMIAGPLYLVWFGLVGHRLLQLGRPPG